MMKITRKKIFLLLAIISAVMLLFIIATTYARYITSTNGNANIAVAKWNIKVNNQSIKNDSDFSSAIAPVFPGNNNIAAGIIAPTAEGYFDLNLDFTNVDVSCNYSINISSEQSTVKDLIITGYTVDGGSLNNINTTNNATITGNSIYTDVAKTHSYRVYIKWNDDSNTSSMNNIDDTYVTIPDNATTNVNVTVSFTQSV